MSHAYATRSLLETRDEHVREPGWLETLGQNDPGFSDGDRRLDVMAERPARRRTDPLAAALAFAIREAVRLDAERMPLPVAPSGANVVPMKKPEAQVA